MFLNVYRTPYDLKWKMLDIPFRVHPSYWVVSSLFVVHYLWTHRSVEFLVAVPCMFVMMVIHELGHALALRLFQTEPSTFLYALGGMTVPNRRLAQRSWRIIVALAGPLTNILMIVMIRLSLQIAPWAVEKYTAFTAAFLIVINLGWGMLNLLPVWPLDGGKVSQEIWMSQNPANGTIRALQMSMVVAILFSIFAILCERHLFPVDPSLAGYRPGYFVAAFFAILFVQNWFDLREQRERPSKGQLPAGS